MILNKKLMVIINSKIMIKMDKYLLINEMVYKIDLIVINRIIIIIKVW